MRLVLDVLAAVRRRFEARAKAGQACLGRDPTAFDRVLVVLAFERQLTDPCQSTK